MSKTEETTADETPAPEAVAAAQADWRDAIDDVKLRGFADQMASPADAVKMAYDLRRKLSRAVVPPGEGAGPEEVRDFHRKLGAPEEVAGYEYERPDLPDHLQPDDAREKDFLQHALGLGVTKDQARGILDWHYASLVEIDAGLAKQAGEGRAQSEAALRREWGGDYDGNIAAAQRALGEFGGEDMLEFLAANKADGVRLADHPRILRAFAEAGRRLGEDSLALPGGDFSGPTLEDRIQEIRTRKTEALTRGDRATAQKLDEEERGLWGKVADV